MAEQFTICTGCDKRLRPMRRYPLQPIVDHLQLSPGQACRRIGLAGSTAKAARCHGISRRTVETIAGKLRVHPSELWPEVIDHDIEDASRTCVGCGGRFLGRRSDAKYCTEKCRRVFSDRRWAAKKKQDDEWVERKRRYHQQHYEDSKRYRLRWQADYYARNREARIEYMRQYRARQREESAA